MKLKCLTIASLARIGAARQVDGVETSVSGALFACERSLVFHTSNFSARCFFVLVLTAAGLLAQPEALGRSLASSPIQPGPLFPRPT
jgi:hypothetical protein